MNLIGWAIDGALLACAIAMTVPAWRLVRGPTVTDRILALDTLYLNSVAVALLLGMRQGSPLLFEVALLIAMFGFVGTVALSRYQARGEVIE
jgi:multicomponent K+:H+ antiporter subunit F